MKKDIKRLLDYINNSPTAFHAVEEAQKLLSENGFKEIDYSREWRLEKGGKYYINKNDSALIAFKVGKGNIEEEGFKLIGAHTDSPTFRVKPDPEMTVEDNYLKLNTEVYGGPIYNTWFDRPLSLAGRVTLKNDTPLTPEKKLIDFNSPLAIIPNLAIHLNRDVNKGVELNEQEDLLPLIQMIEENFSKENYLLELISQQLDVEIEDIVDFDLFLYDTQPGEVIGFNQEFISSARMDDLAMAQAGLQALISTSLSQSTNLLVLFDNEEVGSKTSQGADSPFLLHTLERIVMALGRSRQQFLQSLDNSFMISADMAHAVHPNYSKEHDLTNKPVINQGPVIKINANKSYTTDSVSGGVFAMICEQVDIPYQKFVNRSDKKGGSTIGPISSTQLAIESVDIGNPLLAMHSVRELGGVKDHIFLLKALQEFYNL